MVSRQLDFNSLLYFKVFVLYTSLNKPPNVCHCFYFISIYFKLFYVSNMWQICSPECQKAQYSFTWEYNLFIHLWSGPVLAAKTVIPQTKPLAKAFSHTQRGDLEVFVSTLLWLVISERCIFMREIYSLHRPISK